MALTEAGGGTGILGSLSTFAADAGDSWVIHGNKIFIIGAHVADLIFTVCRTEREARRRQSQSTIMVSRPSEGMTMHPAGEDQLPSLRQRRDQLRRRRGAQGEAGRNRGQAYREIMTVLNPSASPWR
jgi:acyl-CoA dehydrogenase